MSIERDDQSGTPVSVRMPTAARAAVERAAAEEMISVSAFVRRAAVLAAKAALARDKGVA